MWLAFVVTIIVCADRGGLRSFLGWVNSLPLGDKAGHFFLLGVMALLLNHALAYRACSIRLTRVQLGGFVIFVLITLEEFSQLCFTSRTFDVGDLFANGLGILAAECFARWRERER